MTTPGGLCAEAEGYDRQNLGSFTLTLMLVTNTRSPTTLHSQLSPTRRWKGGVVQRDIQAQPAAFKIAIPFVLE